MNDKIVYILKKYNFTPDSITIIGCIIASLSFMFYAKGMFFTGGIVMGIGSLFDAYDGYYARKINSITRFGAFLDSNLDRVSEFFIFFGLFLYYPARIKIIIFFTLFFGIMVSYSKARAEGLGIECKAGIFNRVVRMSLLFAGSILGKNIMIYILILLCLGNLLTFIHRVYHCYKKLV
ncbi:MAG: CDP-alcohol phosphatidyltransferase family protein [Candidatus Hydrogenedentota bacterium]